MIVVAPAAMILTFALLLAGVLPWISLVLVLVALSVASLLTAEHKHSNRP